MFWWAASRVEDLERFEYELDKPVPGESPDRAGDVTVKEEMAGFAALMAMSGQRPTSAG